MSARTVFTCECCPDKITARLGVQIEFVTKHLSSPEILTLGLFGLAWLLPNRAGLDVESEAVVGLYQRPVQGVQFGA